MTTPIPPISDAELSGLEQTSQAIVWSEKVDQILPALLKARSAIPKVAKTKLNPHFSSRYADLADLQDAYKQPLADNSLMVINGQLPTVAGRLGLSTLIMHSSGQFCEATIVLPTSKDTAQGVMGAITYARRANVGLLLDISTDDDDDGNAASGDEPAPAARRPAEPQPMPLISAAGKELRISNQAMVQLEKDAIAEGEKFQGEKGTKQRAFFGWLCAMFDVEDPTAMQELGTTARGQVRTADLRIWIEREIEQRQQAAEAAASQEA